MVASHILGGMIEAILLLVALGLLILTIQNVRDANRDLRAVEELRRNGVLRDIAVHSQIVEWSRAGMAFTATLIVTLSIVLDSELPSTTLGRASAVGFFVVSVLLAMQVVKSRRFRDRLREEVLEDGK